MKNVTLVYGEELGSLVFLLEDVAETRAADIEAVFRLSKYGEARALVIEDGDVPGLSESEDIPDDERYNVRETPEFDNEDWPGRAATVALDYLPDDLDDLGEEAETLMGVPYLHIDPEDEAQVVVTIRDRGYDVRRDDALIKRLCPDRFAS